MAWAESTGARPGEDPYVFSLSPTGDDPWDPDTITLHGQRPIIDTVPQP